MKLLLISNSTNAGEGYLEHALPHIKNFLGNKSTEILFIPFAAVTFTYEEYEKKVNQKLSELGYKIRSVHHFTDPVAAVKNAEAIAVGGGNTWKLLKMIRDYRLIEPVREKVFSGTPYIGWSAGANLASPTIRTTNDMPVVEPDSFTAFNLIPFQINPHYLDVNPEGFAGETREQRIREFIELNPGVYVAGLREGTMLQIENRNVRLIGPKKVRIFIKGAEPVEADNDDDLSFLLNKRI